MIKDYKDLQVWQVSVDFTKLIYQTTRKFPREELFGLTNQIRRSSVSISSNIAEGYMRQYRKEYVQFLFHSLGSCGEIETQLIISKSLKYLNDDNYSILVEKLTYIIRMLRNLIRSLKE